jgi:hypothetical protein
MIVMPSNVTGQRFDALWRKHSSRLGHLLSPGGWRYAGVPYAIDNGAFPAFTKGEPWQLGPFLSHLAKAEAIELEHGERPMWVAVPDVVGDREATLAAWTELAPWIRSMTDYPLALVVQDGMTPADVEALEVQPDVLFIGGSTEWKWSSLAMWCRAFPRIHVGRVNTYARLWRCQELGVESCDGTGLMRTDRQRVQLARFLDELDGPGQLELGMAA